MCAINSVSTGDVAEVVSGREGNLHRLKIGVLRNPHRQNWSSQVDGKIVDQRLDENILFAEYLRRQEIFGSVVLLDNPGQGQVDYTISCSLDCIYTIEVNPVMFYVNTLVTLGLGYLLGLPHQESQASYVAQAIFSDNHLRDNPVVAGSLVFNYRTWYWDNIYWRPDFYGENALDSLFRQILYDFLTRSGCLQ